MIKKEGEKRLSIKILLKLKETATETSNFLAWGV
jgi:hypothetical protein